ncbi:MAG: hypothetical protein ABW165_02495 [Candidatus Thiodiazotropha sp.]
MTNSIFSDKLDPDLRGQRVGLSGAIPETDEWAGRALDWELLNAVSTLADRVFSGGGHLVHGSHPSFTPRILAQAKPYAHERGEPVVTFVLSGLYGDSRLAQLLHDPKYHDVLHLILVDPVILPGHEGHGAEDSVVRNASFKAMRERLIDEMDALVVIGGKRWRNSDNKPGTLEELKLARARNIPCYLLGGFGGMAADLSVQPEFTDLFTSPPTDADMKFVNPDFSVKTTGEGLLDNGLTVSDNEFLRTSNDYGRTITLVTHGLEVSRLMPHGTKMNQ